MYLRLMLGNNHFAVHIILRFFLHDAERHFAKSVCINFYASRFGNMQQEEMLQYASRFFVVCHKVLQTDILTFLVARTGIDESLVWHLKRRTTDQDFAGFNFAADLLNTEEEEER